MKGINIFILKFIYISTFCKTIRLVLVPGNYSVKVFKNIWAALVGQY